MEGRRSRNHWTPNIACLTGPRIALKNYYHRGAKPDLYFRHDSTGHEIDLLPDPGGDLAHRDQVRPDLHQ